MAKYSASQRRFFIDVNFRAYNQLEDKGDYSIGFDLSLTSTGYAVVDLDSGELEDKGLIETGRKDDGPKANRLLKIYDSMIDIINTYNAKTIGYEAVRVKKQLGSFQALSQVLTCFQMARYREGPPNFSLSLTPSQIKKAAGEQTGASKKEIVESIEQVYDGNFSNDEADAAAVARIGKTIDDIAPVYESVRNMKIKDVDDDKLYDFLLDIRKRRQKLFENSVSEYDNACIDTVLGAFSGKSGLNTLARNYISTYYDALDKSKELYG